MASRSLYIKVYTMNTSKEIIASKILELKRDFEVIKGLKSDVTQGSLANTMMRLQDYTRVKDRFFKEVNQLQLDSLQVMSKLQYIALQNLIKTFHKEL